MTKVLVSVLAIVFPVLFMSTPVLATKGIDAARKCNANPRCILQFYADGSIVIVVNGQTIECKSPQSECTVLTIQPGAVSPVTPPASPPKRR